MAHSHASMDPAEPDGTFVEVYIDRRGRTHELTITMGLRGPLLSALDTSLSSCGPFVTCKAGRQPPSQTSLMRRNKWQVLRRITIDPTQPCPLLLLTHWSPFTQDAAKNLRIDMWEVTWNDEKKQISHQTFEYYNTLC